MENTETTPNPATAVAHQPAPASSGQARGHRPSEIFREQLPQYLVVRSSESDSSGQSRHLSNLNPFQREQALSKFGEPKHVFKRADGTLEVHMTRDSEIRRLLSATEMSYRVRGQGICRVPIKVEPHPTKNSVKGVIFCPDLRGVFEEEIVEGMEKEGVVQARRIRRKEQGALVDTDTVVLTMNRLVLPERVKVGYLSVPIRLFIQDPIRCYKCQAFGHTSQRCRGRQRCGRCSSEDHGSADCSSDTPRCANCSGRHGAADRKCPKLRL